MLRAFLAVAVILQAGAESNAPVLHPSIAKKYERFVQQAGAKPPDKPLEHPVVLLKRTDGTVVYSSELQIPDDMLHRRGVRYHRYGNGKTTELFAYEVRPVEGKDGEFREPKLPVPYFTAQRLFRRFLLEREEYTAVTEGTRRGTETWRAESTPKGLVLHLPDRPARLLVENVDADEGGRCLKQHGTRIVRSVAFKEATFVELEHPQVVGDWEGAAHCQLKRTLVEVGWEGSGLRFLCNGEACAGGE